MSYLQSECILNVAHKIVQLYFSQLLLYFCKQELAGTGTRFVMFEILFYVWLI